jgi:large subunit ribosomal protein L22
MLRALPQAGADYLYKVIKSAAANAVHNNKWDESELVIGELLVNEGPRSKRFQPKARGRIYQITKRSSHIIVRIARKSKKGGA